ncbi:MAG: DEAD/DEAH box helicase [Rickettsiales bacterium]|nr:DEAD/DEAH box helicase [Rickettsiales bacterium]
MTNSIREKIQILENQLQEVEKQKSLLQKELENAKQELQKHIPQLPLSSNKIFSPEEKIKIFMDFFRGRIDVFPKRWNNTKSAKSGYSLACSNEWVRGKCNKPNIKCSECTNQAFIPLSAEVIRKHLGGEDFAGGKRDYTIGIYPMLADDTCWFLATDFDKDKWQQDVSAFIKTCRKNAVPFVLERSRSGNGGHVWIFFEKPILAAQARKMGSALLTETMDDYPEIGFESYDRFFPNQDTLPSGGFGNLIALPLQHFPRENGNSIFLDENFEPYQDQWQFLASVPKMSEEAINKIVEEASRKGRILGVRMPVAEDEETPWQMKPSRKESETIIDQNLPKSVNVVISNQIFIEKPNLPSALISKLIRIAAFQNPEFYIAQSMRLSTFGKPRIIACAENFAKHLGLPRGCLDEAVDLLKSLGIEANIDDKRYGGKRVKLNFLGELTSEQQKAAKKLLQHDNGVLAATTAFGKTVIGAHMIAKRKTNTLVIVHRRQLLDQWIERLKIFLNINSDQIGIIGSGKRKPSGIVDIAIMQSLIKDNVVDDIVAEYGQVIVDECHHLSAVSFEAVIKACKAKYVLGLTATASRKDGHHPIIFMQCGPIRYKVDAKEQAKLRSFNHKVELRNTAFALDNSENQKPSISHIYSEITNNEQRNQLIIDDILNALKLGRCPLILTERKDHAAFFEQHLSKFCKNVIVMVGGQNAKKRAAVKLQLEPVPENEERIIIATGRYIGEGFDDKRLDTLFLTMPISWHGTLAQYAGRLHRDHVNKKEVIVYDYVDGQIPMLAKMAEKRMKGYLRIGYQNCSVSSAIVS